MMIRYRQRTPHTPKNPPEHESARISSNGREGYTPTRVSVNRFAWIVLLARARAHHYKATA